MQLCPSKNYVEYNYINYRKLNKHKSIGNNCKWIPTCRKDYTKDRFVVKAASDDI